MMIITRHSELLEYSEVAVSISSFCKLLNRNSYGYLLELASAIWGINAGSSISCQEYNKQNAVIQKSSKSMQIIHQFLLSQTTLMT